MHGILTRTRASVIGPLILLLAFGLALPVQGKMPPFETSVVPTEGAVTITVTVNGVDPSVPPEERCCGHRLEGLYGLYPANDLGSEMRAVDASAGKTIVLEETTPGVYVGRVSLTPGTWVAVPFPGSDIERLDRIQFDEMYPTVTFEIDGGSNHLSLLLGIGFLIFAGVFLAISSRGRSQPVER